ncbi:MAG: GH3 auxin-responsive promoter family protein [Flavobacteriales bacterium]|nr:GH3 auxin-responsive promoter family protein [Flavobacteriales bacterium]
MRKTSLRQLVSLVNYGLNEDFFTKGVLVLGGSTALQNMGNYYQGDLSGINQAKMPFWTQPFYKPGKQIARYKDWNLKIDEIARNAPKWDIGMLTGIPAWNQLVLERIIEMHGLKNIHELWPNLEIFIYGGVAFEPYRKRFEKLLGHPIHYLETYLASEGFIAYQNRKDVKGMQLVLDNGIFLEFIPFDKDNFNPDGSLKPHPETLLIHEVELNVDYAILLSTNAGIWRYLIGDTIKFTSISDLEIIITGRTKHFLSLCGEHLSIENMNHAIEKVANELNTPISEFTVSGINVGSLFGHKWYVGMDAVEIDKADLVRRLDDTLKELNDDYAVERKYALKEVQIEVIPTTYFYEWMEKKGKIGAQYKFPRVLQREMFIEWEAFVNDKMKN